MKHDGLAVHLENLLGGLFILLITLPLMSGGLAGLAGDDILTMVGEDVLARHKVGAGHEGTSGNQDKLSNLVKTGFRKELSKFLEI